MPDAGAFGPRGVFDMVTTTRTSTLRSVVALSTKSLIVGLVILFVATVTGYVLLKINHDDGADILAVGMSTIISSFVVLQNAQQQRDLDRVRNQTNGVVHHVMRENTELRRAVIDTSTNDEETPNDHRE